MKNPAADAKKKRFTPASRQKQTYEVFLSILAVLSVVIVGVIGYVVIEGWDFFDALYMTVTTLTTVGYQEVHPLSGPGRAFTMVLVVVGVGTAMLVLTTTARSVLERQIEWSLARHGMKEKLTTLQGHTIFCGYGRLSKSAAVELRDYSSPVLVIDKMDERIHQAEEAGLLVLRGDATTEETLAEAGIKRAKCLVSLLPKDADNLYVVLTSRELNPNLHIISRAEDEAGEKRLRKAGANRVVSPFREGGQKVAMGLLKPHVTDFLDLAISSTRGELFIEEFKVPEDTKIHGHSLQEAGVKEKTNVTVLTIISQSGEMLPSPSGKTIIERGSTIIGLGCKQDFDALMQLFEGNLS